MGHHQHGPAVISRDAGKLFRAGALGRVPADQNAAFARRRQAYYCAKPAAGQAWPKSTRDRSYSWRIESKFQAAALASFSPTRSVVSLTKRYGGTGRLYGAGTPEKTRPAGSYFEPWHGQK
jgi:hypothetical protein